MKLNVAVEYISAACNRTYNCMDLTNDLIVYGAHKAIAVYDLLEEKVVRTIVAHKGRVNCVRFVKKTERPAGWLVTCCSAGLLILWRPGFTGEQGPDAETVPNLEYKPIIVKHFKDVSINVCDAVQISEDCIIVGCITGDSVVMIYSLSIRTEDPSINCLQEISLKKSLALELVFHSFDSKNLAMALGMDSGSVVLYHFERSGSSSSSLESKSHDAFVQSTTLNKHEDWVRCISFATLENGETLMASGGQDSYIAVWRFTKSKTSQSDFEFQVHQFQEYTIVFDSMIIGHEGWINSLNWNDHGELLSCSSDQSIIIWQNTEEIWMEKSRFGVIGGMTPGGFGAKFNNDTLITSGFQGSIQIWRKDEDGSEWELRPSVTGHFGPITDMNYDNLGNYVVSTSEDQTTRVHALWGIGRWHEIARPQIHGHDIFACRTIGTHIVSGAEEKILRAFQPTQVFYKNLEDASEILVQHKEAAKAAFLPALGLSNQSENTDGSQNPLQESLDIRLDEDFIRSQTLWLEVSKLYGHVYEISCIATSPVDPLVASASQATKPQFAAIILWCSKRWKNLGEFPLHKLNVTGMEFSRDGKRLLSVSRDRTWAVWEVSKVDGTDDFSIKVLDTGNLHSRALWVGTWAPNSEYFVTGARDKKLVVWKHDAKTNKYAADIFQTFEHSVSAAAVNSDGLIAVGLESGEMSFYQYKSTTSNNDKLTLLVKLNESAAHHETIRRIEFNPKIKTQLCSAGSDHILKVYEISCNE